MGNSRSWDRVVHPRLPWSGPGNDRATDRDSLQTDHGLLTRCDTLPEQRYQVLLPPGQLPSDRNGRPFSGETQPVENNIRDRNTVLDQVSTA